MINWPKTRLSCLCTRIGDGLHGTPEYSEKGNVYFINGNNLKDGKIVINSDTKKVSESEYKKNHIELNCYSLLIGINGSLGNMAFYSGETVMLGKSSAYLNFKTDINKFYYYYFQLQSIQKYFYDVATGSTIKNLSLKSLQDFEVPLPSEIEYKKIASVLSALDDKIELNNKINAELEAMAKTLYDYWFVQFDFSNEDGKPYKSSGGEMVYDEILKREIPKGWEVKSLGDFVAKDKSGDWGKEEIEGNYTTKVECIRGADINGINGKGEVKAPTRYILEKNEHKILNEGDLVVEISGGSPTQSTGRLAYVTKEVIDRFKNPIICSNFCKAVSLKAENQFFYFIYSWYRAYDNGIFFGFEGKTSGIKNLLFESLVDTYKVATPSDDLLDKFEATISTLEQKRQLNLKQNQELASLRDWLLPMLMNGQVTIASAYKEVEEKLAMVADGEVKYGK
jgi:type I restriction enzyme S subunit